MGRPSSYDPKFADIAKRMCLLKAATDEDLAGIFGVDVRTIGNWKNDHPEFFQAIKEGKDEADLAVVVALHKKATGFKQTRKVLPKGASAVVDVEEYFPPDTAAGIFWLANRQRQSWKQRQTIEGDPDSPLTVEIVKFSEQPKKKAAASA